MPLDRQFGPVIGQAGDRTVQPNSFGNIHEEIVDRLRADDAQHFVTVVAGQG
jgi:hypothetical protein